jgi:hypothetical protein
LSTASSTLGLSFAAQPAAFAIVVNRTDSVKISCLQRKWIIAYRCEREGKALENSTRTCRGAHGNYDFFVILARDRDVALTFEHCSWLDHHARGMNFARNDAGGLNGDFLRRADCAVEPAGNDHLAAADLALNGRVLAEDQGFLGNDCSLHLGINAKGALGFEFAVDLDSLFEEAGPDSSFL